MKRSLFFTFFIISIFLGNNVLNAQSLTIPPGTVNIGPILIGESSDGTHTFTVTGSGYSNGAYLYVDALDSRFTISLTGTSGTFYPSLTYNADASGNVSQPIYVKYTPTTLGQVVDDLEFYDYESWTWQYKEVRGVGKGPEMKMEGRETSSDPWDEILDGETTPSVSEGTDFGDALVGGATVDRIFKISNTNSGGYSGNLVLTEYETNKYVQISGTNADQFSVFAEPSTPVPPDNDSTKFTIRFTPTSAGIKTAEISIGNNDPEPNSENPYNFAIKGNGTVVLPDPPTAIAATSINHNSFYANWTQGGGGTTTGYYLDVATDNGFTGYVTGYENLDVGDVNTYLVSGLDANDTYYYRLRAYNAGGTSANSNTISPTTAPAVPTATSATNVGTENFYANWGFIPGATSYKLDVNTQPDFSGTIILDNVDVTNTYRNVTGLTGGTTYYYRVRSYNGNSSGNSNIITAITFCNAPPATDATDIKHDEFTANWNAPAGGAPDYYKLDVSLNQNFSSYVYGFENLTVYVTSKLVDGLTQNTTYYYRVRAVNAAGASTNSNTISIHTYAGANTEWTGNISTDWNTYGNWDNGVPYSITDVIIPSGTVYPIVNADANCNDLTINAGAELTVSSGYYLFVHGDFLLKADATATGSLVEYGGVSVTGQADVELYLFENRWHYVSSPVTSAVSDVFFDIYLKYYNEPTTTWTYIVNLGVPLPPGQGYAAWSSPVWFGSTTVTFNGGPLNEGNTSIPVSYNVGSGGDGWNLGGNPYPCAIDWDDANWTKTNIDGAVYVWNGVQYLVWVNGTGDLTNGIIPAMQSFFVKANAPGPALQVTNSAKLHGYDPYKGSGVDQLLELTVNGNGYNDKTFIYFNEYATEGFDSDFDAYKKYGIDEAPQLYSIAGDEILSINVLPEMSSGMAIPLGFEVGAETEYTIIASDLESFGLSTGIYLEDIQESVMTDLTEQNEYTFVANPEDDPARFIIHFGVVGIEDQPLDVETNKDITIYSVENSVYIRNNTKQAIQGDVSICNTMGQEIIRTKLLNNSLNKIDVNTEAGYYIVKVNTGTNLYTEKVFIK
ncbi:MAG: fibronectin type III domain-containing protein [Bacteroidales bacterium]|nr:fibronectin type III domain-containing protein [Bacteroidales bacterium]